MCECRHKRATVYVEVRLVTQFSLPWVTETAHWSSSLCGKRFLPTEPLGSVAGNLVMRK